MISTITRAGGRADRMMRELRHEAIDTTAPPLFWMVIDMSEAYDADGNALSKKSLLTISEASDVEVARQYAADFMNRPNRIPGGAVAEQMLNLKLRPIGSTGVATHYGCFRVVWSDEFSEQESAHLNEWSELPSFWMLEGSLEESLEALGLEVFE